MFILQPQVNKIYFKSLHAISPVGLFFVAYFLLLFNETFSVKISPAVVFIEGGISLRQLLLISCSKNKRNDQSVAIEMYDGPYYKIVRKLIREGKFPETLDILILSAKYGLVKSNDWLEYYDQIMTQERAKELNSVVLVGLENAFRDVKYSDFYINLGENYMKAIEGYQSIVPKYVTVIVSQGEIGMRMSAMKKWIESLNEMSELG